MVRVRSKLAKLRCHAALLQIEVEAMHVMYTTRDQMPKKRRLWARKWLGESRRYRFGLYDQLMFELRNEDKKSFENFMRMPSEMFDELVNRLSPRITKKSTTFRKSIPAGMKVAITLRHLASGTNYHSMRFGWRVPHNSISIIVKQVRLTMLIHVG